MRKYVNKLTLSIALVVLSLLTMVATTYAWVGLLTSSTFDEFSINLQFDDGEKSEYGLSFSLTGENGSFKEDISETEIQRVLLTNCGIDVSKYNDNYVNQAFMRNRLDQCTAVRTGAYSLGNFTNMFGDPTTNYYWFDLYLSVFKIGDPEDAMADNRINLYLKDYVLQARETSTNPNGVYSMRMMNPVTYPGVNPAGENILGRDGGIPLGTTIQDNVAIDISNACRVAFEKYETTDKGDPSAATSISRKGLYIYQNGSTYPVFDSVKNVYDFGGVLPTEYNFARLYYNTTHPDSPIGEVPDEVLNRGDVTFEDDGVTNKIVDLSDNVTTSKMIRFRVYFWFEGWDSDCFDVIDRKDVLVNLSFTTKNPNN